MALNKKIDPSVAHVAFSRPIPGQSFAQMPPRQAKWQHAPKYTKLEDAANFIMDSITEPQHLKTMLNILESGMSIEAVTRTILFTGFTEGLWTPNLMLLLYKPTMLALIAIAHRANLKDTPLVLPEAHAKYHNAKLQEYMLMQKMKQKNDKTDGIAVPPNPLEQEPQQPTGQGFMQRSQGTP